MEIIEGDVASCFIGCCNFPSAAGFSNCIAYVIGLMTTVTLEKGGIEYRCTGCTKRSFFLGNIQFL